MAALTHPNTAFPRIPTNHIRCGVTVSIRRFHRRDRGSIPRNGGINCFFCRWGARGFLAGRFFLFGVRGEARDGMGWSCRNECLPIVFYHTRESAKRCLCEPARANTSPRGLWAFCSRQSWWARWAPKRDTQMPAGLEVELVTNGGIRRGEAEGSND